MTNGDQLQQDLPGTVSRRRLGQFDWIDSSCQYENWVKRLAKPERWLLPPAEPLRQFVPGREVVRATLDDAAIADAVLKQLMPCGLLETIKWSWRESRAFQAFQLGRQLGALGCLTELPVAARERCQWGGPCEYPLLTRFIPHATLLHRINSRCVDRRRRLGIGRGLAKLRAALHAAGYSHHSPSRADFLAVPQLDNRDAIVLINLVGLRQRREMSLTNAAEDLRRLLPRGNFPRRERTRFIVTYSRSRESLVDPRQLLSSIGASPAKATYPHRALDEHGRPVTTA